MRASYRRAKDTEEFWPHNSILYFQMWTSNEAGGAGGWTSKSLSFGRFGMQHVTSAQWLPPRDSGGECMVVAGMNDGQVGNPDSTDILLYCCTAVLLYCCTALIVVLPAIPYPTHKRLPLPRISSYH